MRNLLCSKGLRGACRSCALSLTRSRSLVPPPRSIWLVALYRTVMPEPVIGSAYREKPGVQALAQATLRS